MRAFILLLIVILAGCASEPQVHQTPVEDNNNQSAPEIEQRMPVVVIENETRQTVNTDGYPAPRQRSGVQLLVSDGSQAARLFLHVGEAANLSMQVPVLVAVQRIGSDGTVMLRVNNETHTAEEDENFYALDRRVIVDVSDVFVVE